MADSRRGGLFIPGSPALLSLTFRLRAHTDSRVIGKALSHSFCVVAQLGVEVRAATDLVAVYKVSSLYEGLVFQVSFIWYLSPEHQMKS